MTVEHLTGLNWLHVKTNRELSVNQKEYYKYVQLVHMFCPRHTYWLTALYGA
jgi:hypothetical protein